MLKDLFKRKRKKETEEGLLKAQIDGLITQEEFFRITLERAENNLKNYLEEAKQGKSKRAKK